MARQTQNKLPRVSLPLGDFGRALDIADRFNIASGARKGARVQKILGQALAFTQPLVKALDSGSVLWLGGHGDMAPYWDRDEACAIARKKDKTAYLAGNVFVRLSKTGAAAITDIRHMFSLSSDAQAATLSIHVYGDVLGNLASSSNFSIMHKDGTHVPYDTARLSELVTGPREP